MDHVDIILQLKDLLRDTCGKQAISHLIQFPLIIDYLSAPSNFQKVAETLGKDCQNWNPTNICRVASGFDLKSSLIIGSQFQDDPEIEAFRKSINPQSIEKINSIVEIHTLATRIIDLNSKLPWSQILEQIGLGIYSFSDPKKKLETIFEVVFELSEDKNNFIKSLIDQQVGKAGQKMLSRMLLNNSYVIDLVSHEIETRSIKPIVEDFVSFLNELRLLGDQEIQKILAEVFLKVYPFDEKSKINKELPGISNDLLQLQYLKNYSALLQIIGNNDDYEKLTRISKDVLSRLGQGLGFTTHFELSENLDPDISSTSNSGKEITQEVKHINNIAKTDKDSANTLALEFSQKILDDPGFASSIIDEDHGSLIAPATLVEFLINFDLISQANALLDKLITQWPQNSSLLKIAANLAHDKGDHYYAAGKFALLYINNELTREEKIKFSASLEYLSSWDNAFRIRKAINISTDENYRDLLICAFHAGKINEVTSLISENRKLIRSAKLTSILQKIAEENKEQIILMIENLDASDYSNDEDQKYFCLISDYLQKIGENDVATAILENCTRYSRFSLSIINRLYSIYTEKGEREKCRVILASIKNQPLGNQKEIETFIDFLIQTGEIDRANQFLLEIENSWELSPRKINLQAKIFIEKGKFSEAEKMLTPPVQNASFDIENKFNYCLAILKCKHENFPFGIAIEKQNKYDELLKIIELGAENKNLLIELLQAELTPISRFENYQLILNKYSNGDNPEIWRIYAGLGKLYFDLNQYDSAIINLKHAYQIQPKNQHLFWLLIQSYASLRLWNEIESLFNQGMAQDSRSILRNFEEFGILSENSEWPHFLENQIQKKPEEIVYKVFLAQYYAGKGKRTEAVEIIQDFYEKLEVDNELYLLCVQILLEANETQLAERLIEIFLVNKKSLDQSDHLACAFLYEQLGKPEKALAMMNHVDNQDLALLTFKSKLLNDLGKTEQFQKLINEIIEKDDQFTYSLGEIRVKTPAFVRQIQENPAIIHLMASASAVKEKDTSKAISILERGLKKNPENQEIQFKLLDLINITGKGENNEGLWEKLSVSASEGLSSSLLCLLGEIALSRGEEVKSAQFLSQALKISPEEPRIKALQARIVAINGNLQEAEMVLNQVIQSLDKKNNEIFGSTTESYLVDSRFWLAKAAKDLKDNKKSLEICLHEILQFGYNTPVMDLFLNALSAELENRFVLHEIKANDQNNLELNEWLKILSNIIENHSTSHSDSSLQEELIIKCQLFLENDPKVLAKAEILNPNPDNINSKILAVFKLKGLDAAEIAFNSFATNENNEFFIAVLEKDVSPEKALKHLQNASQSTAADAIHNALLAIIEKNLGNFSDAYAAIHLALEAFPNEYEWQIMAGDLCKLKGDLHSSISHYQKAQNINLTQGIDKKIDNLYLSLGTTDAIPILEKQLAQNPNKDQTIQLGKIYIKSGNYRKAVKVFESAAKEYPNSADPYYWLSEIAINLGNPGKALENIEDAIARDGLNNQYLCKKAEIINKIDGFSQAVSFIDEVLKNNDNKDIELLKYKVRLISEHEGENEALKVLNMNLSIKEIPELMLEKALLDLRLGKIDESELIAEKLLDIKNVKANALALLGSISRTKGEFDRAIDFYVKSIESDPFSIEKFIQLAEIYHDRKEFKNAIKTLEDGIRSNPGSFDLLYRSGLYLYQQGGYNEADKYIREAIKIKPDHRESKELLGMLDNVIAVGNYSVVDQIAE